MTASNSAYERVNVFDVLLGSFRYLYGAAILNDISCCSLTIGLNMLYTSHITVVVI